MRARHFLFYYRHFAKRQRENGTMTDLMWLGVLAGLFLLTLLYIRLCEVA
jgi:hypothetical protein